MSFLISRKEKNKKAWIIDISIFLLILFFDIMFYYFIILSLALEAIILFLFFFNPEKDYSHKASNETSNNARFMCREIHKYTK